MQYGFVLPDIDLQNIGSLAREAEEAGWDGVFIPDCISIETKNVPAFPFFDPWVALGLVAVATSRIRFGTMVTAVSAPASVEIGPRDDDARSSFEWSLDSCRRAGRRSRRCRFLQSGRKDGPEDSRRIAR